MSIFTPKLHQMPGNDRNTEVLFKDDEQQTRKFDANKVINFLTKFVSSTKENIGVDLLKNLQEDTTLLRSVQELLFDLHKNTLQYDKDYPELSDMVSLFLHDMQKIKHVFFNAEQHDQHLWNLLAYYYNKQIKGEKMGNIQLDDELKMAIGNINVKQTFPDIERHIHK